MKQKVIIVGAGPAGLEAACQLAQSNYQVYLLEKELQVGGNLRNWAKLFPDFDDASAVRSQLSEKAMHPNIDLKEGVAIEEIYFQDGEWHAKDAKGHVYSANAALLTTGFTPFNASRKEELGYGIYENVITSVDFEKMISTETLLTVQGTTPKRIAFLNCVGSRDEKVGNHYCSRICCINGVKQAVECKKLIPDAEVYCFYMDLRMSGQGYEELYRESQQTYGVQYIRGRISEAAGTIDNKIQIKSEDTLTGFPLKLTVDLLVLMVGMEPSASTIELGNQNQIAGKYGFAKSIGLYDKDNYSQKEGLFLAGSCKRPLALPETLVDAKAAALEISTYLKTKETSKKIST